MPHTEGPPHDEQVMTDLPRTDPSRRRFPEQAGLGLLRPSLAGRALAQDPAPTEKPSTPPEQRQPQPPGEEGLRDHLIMEVIYQSARENRPVRLERVAALVGRNL